MWRRRTSLPPDLRAALRAARRRAWRDRWRTRLWRWRAPVGPVLALAAALAGWQAWRSVQAPAPLPRVIYGEAPAPSQPGARWTLRASTVDGDTLASGSLRLRLHAIDAPEMGQTCTRQGRAYDCGEEARRAMARILGGGMLACEGFGTDQYGRRIARCTNAAGQDIAAALVEQGWAIAFRRFGEDYVAQEDQARRAGRGLWAGSFEAPSDYRRRLRP